MLKSALRWISRALPRRTAAGTRVSWGEATEPWNYEDYVREFNQGEDVNLVDRYFTEDCVMISTSGVRRGRQELKKFLHWAHDGVREIIRPQLVLRDGRQLFAEIDMDFVASKARDDFPFGALRPGDILTVKFFALYTLRDGLIAELRTMTWPAEQGVSKAPRLGASAGQRAAFFAYTRAFSSAEYERFSAFYTQDVVLELNAMTPIRGRQGIVDFYAKMFPSVSENLEIHQITADDAGIAGDFTSVFTALEDAPDFVVAPLSKGEAIRVRVFVHYKLRDGLICHIKVVRAGAPQKIPRRD
jgi:ketosteroid isomerase-like protein